MTVVLAPTELKDALLDVVFSAGISPPLFSTFKISSCALLGCEVSLEKSGLNKLEPFLCHFFFLLVLEIVSLSLHIQNWNTACLGVNLDGLTLTGVLCPSWTWVVVPFFRYQKFPGIISKYGFYFFGILKS